MVARPSRSVLGIALLLGLAACKGETDEPRPARGADEERTVVTVQSYVYATQGDTSLEIVGRVRDQIRSAFGALKTLRVTGSNREVANDAGEMLYREPLILVRSDGRESVVVRVWYRYSDEVVAPATVPRGVPMLVGGLHRQDDADFDRILIACTDNTVREREYRGRLQSVFDGTLPSCQDAILAEQAVIDAARVRLHVPEDEIVPEEMNRVYLPVVARLMERKAAQMGRYPRFEAVRPVSARVAAATSAAVAGRPAAVAAVATEDEDDDGLLAGVLPGEASPAAAQPEAEPAPGDKPAPIVVPGGGAAAPGPAGAHAAAEDQPHDPNAPPEPPSLAPVVVADGPKGPGGPVQPRGNDGLGNFEWEDLLDKKFLALWIAVFALYPLLRRKSS